MEDTIRALLSTPLLIILLAGLVLGGILFLFLAFTGRFVGDIKISRERQNLARIIGVSLLSCGMITLITLYVVKPPEVPPSPDETVAPSAAAETPASEPTLTPTSVPPTATLTPLPPTATSIIPAPTATETPPVSLPSEVSAILMDPRVVYHDDFDELSPIQWLHDSEYVEALDGLVEITGTPGWEPFLNWIGDLNEGEGALILLKYDSGTAFDLRPDTGEWGTPSYKRWGIAHYGGTFNVPLFQGGARLDRPLIGNLSSRSDTWYCVLLAVGKDAQFLARVWERDDPSRRSEYRRTFDNTYEGQTWWFRMNAGKGKVYLDSFTHVSFSDLEELPAAGAHFWAGESHYAQEDLDAALAEFDQAVQLDPNVGTYYAYRGSVYWDLGERSIALRDLTRATELDANNQTWFRWLAERYLWVGNYEQGLANANRAIELDPGYAENYIVKGCILRDLGDDSRAAIALFTKAIELDPEPWPYMERCQTYRNLGDYATALEDCNRCVELGPNDKWCYFQRGWTHDGLGNSAAAVEDLERYLELITDPDDCPSCVEDAQEYIEEHSG